MVKKYFLLTGILFLAAFISYIPHLNYNYPLHVDEWHHITIAKQIVETGILTSNPYKGAILGDLEIGYHLLLALIQKATGLGISIAVYLPAFLSVISVLFVFLLARRWGEAAGFVSAILTALIPSNVTIGGPSLLLPLNLALIFIPLSLLVAFNAKSFRDVIILALINVFVFFAHPPTAIPMFLLLFIYVLFNLKDDEKKAKLIFLSLLIPFALGLFQLLVLIEIKGFEALIYTFWVWLSKIPDLFGYIQTAFFILGFYLLGKHGKKEDWTLLLGTASFLIVIFFYIQTGWLPLFSYHRIYMSLFILMVLVTGYGISRIKSKPLLLIVLSVILVLSLKQSFSTPYYHIINEEDYQNFVWIKQNTGQKSIALLDPWKARAFPAIAERLAFTVMPLGPNKEALLKNKLAYDFFNADCTNTTFLEENNISVVYSPVICKNKDLLKVKENIYFLKEN